MGIILMFVGFLFFALGLDMAFSDRFGKKSKNAAPVILLISIVLFCGGVIVNKGNNAGYSLSGYTGIKPSTIKPDAQSSSGEVSEGSFNGSGGQGEGQSADNKAASEDKEDGERPKGWANGLGGSFEKWKELFGPPDQVELVNNTGKATFLDHYLHADFTNGKVTSFSLDFNNMGGYKLNEAKKEVNQFIPPDSELMDRIDSRKDKTYIEFYRSEIMKKDFMETDMMETDMMETDDGQISPEEFNVIYHKMDNGNIYKVHVETEVESKTNQ